MLKPRRGCNRPLLVVKRGCGTTYQPVSNLYARWRELEKVLFEIKKFYNGDVIFTEGELGDAAYILRKGRVEISIGRDADRVTLAELTAPAVFGEIAVLLRGQRRTATATALEYSEAAEIDKPSFMRVLDSTDEVIGAVLNAAVERLKETTARVTGAPDVYGAVSEFLDLFAHHHETGGGAAGAGSGSDGPELEYFLTLRTFSSALRAPASDVEEAFKTLHKADLIEYDTNDHGKKVARLKTTRGFAKAAQAAKKG